MEESGVFFLQRLRRMEERATQAQASHQDDEEHRDDAYVWQVHLRLFVRAVRVLLSGIVLILLTVAARDGNLTGGRSLFLITGVLFFLELAWFLWRVWVHRNTLFRRGV